MYIKDALGRDLSIVKFTTTGSTTTSGTEYFVYGTDRVARVTVSATTPLAKIQPDEATYFLYDHLGNTRVAFSVNGSNVPLIVNALDYYSYGKILREYDNGAGDRYLTTGHERDQKTGLDYRGARYYDSDVARFLSTDPWAVKYPNWSTYNYVMGNPIVLIDPTGKGPTNWIRNKETGDVEWRSEVKSEETTPDGYEYIGRYYQGLTVKEFKEHPESNGVIIQIGYNDRKGEEVDVRWIQIVQTSNPRDGVSETFVDPQPDNDDKPFYFSDNEMKEFSKIEGQDIVFKDGPYRPKAIENVSWLGELSVVKKEGDSYKPVVTVTYGFEVKDCIITVKNIKISNPSEFALKTLKDYNEKIKTK